MNKQNLVQRILKKHPLELILVVLFVVLANTAPNFATAGNLWNIAQNMALPGIIAFGMTMVIISGEIDLSVGSMVAVTGCIAAWGVDLGTFTFDLPPAISVPIAIILALTFGVLSGVFVGFLRYWFNVPTFITSLGLLLVLFGLANLVTGGFPIASFPEWYGFLGSGRLFGVVPFKAVIFLTVFVVIYFIMEHTTLGRSIYAVGGNTHAARVSGIRVWRVKIIALSVTSGLAALCGILTSAEIMSGNPGTARGLELDIVASVIIGGAALSGGIGRVAGTFVGVIFVGMVLNGMVLLNIDEYWQYVVRGGLIIGAVLLNQVQSKTAQVNR